MSPHAGSVTRPLRCTIIAATAGTLLATVFAACSPTPGATSASPAHARRLPTGERLDPVGRSLTLGSMPLSIAIAPDSSHAAVLLGGWREQGVQIVDLATGRVTQTIPQAAAFLGVAFAPDGHALYTSGGNGDVIYRYAWDGSRASLADSLILAAKASPRASGTRYPAGVALSPDGTTLYAAENLADSIAVVNIAQHRVVQRLATDRYPYGVAVAPDGTVYVSAWGGHTVSVFTGAPNGTLVAATRIPVARHPSALLLDRTGERLFVASGSTDRVDVIDTRSRTVITTLNDAPPAGPAEGSTPNALALSPDGTALYVAEADANAVAVFPLSAHTSGIASARGDDRLAGRVPVEWYPDALGVTRGNLLVVNGKGRGTAPNVDGPQPLRGEPPGSRNYTLGQTTGTLGIIPLSDLGAAQLASNTARVVRANGWDRPQTAPSYPPIRHVIYIIKENRTYDQVLGDLPVGDGDPSLVFFPRAVSPNHHALAERFGVFDRFFVNAEVSPDGHNWSTAAYATDYLEKTVPSNYSDRGRTYDYEGTNGGFGPRHVPNDDVAAPALGYLWDAARQAGITYRNYGEFVVREDHGGPSVPGRYEGDKPALVGHTDPRYAGFDLAIPDQVRVAEWLREFDGFVHTGDLPALEIVRLPNDHTSGARGGMPTPRAYMADNDLALGRMVDAVSHSPYWKSTAFFVLEDDAQNGPDHVDSHRSVLLVISPYMLGGVLHRFVNTTDVVATIADILHLPAMSQFQYYGRPLRDVFGSHADLRPYTALTPSVPLTETNPHRTALSRASARLDLSQEDRANEYDFNHILWRAIKGPGVPYPAPHRISAAAVRSGQ